MLSKTLSAWAKQNGYQIDKKVTPSEISAMAAESFSFFVHDLNWITKDIVDFGHGVVIRFGESTATFKDDPAYFYAKALSETYEFDISYRAKTKDELFALIQSLAWELEKSVVCGTTQLAIVSSLINSGNWKFHSFDGNSNFFILTRKDKNEQSSPSYR